METTVSLADSVTAPIEGTAATGGKPLNNRIMQRLAETVGSRRYQMWFDRSTYLTFNRDENQLDVAVPNRFVMDWIGRHFAKDLREAAETELGSVISVNLHIDQEHFGSGRQTGPSDRPDGVAAGSASGEARPIDSDASEDQVQQTIRSTGGVRRRDSRNAFDRFSLDRFVVGPSTELAYTAATQLSDADDGVSGLVFIHGDCGLGKTHLLHGVCGRMLRQRPQSRVRYYSAEQFTNEFLAAVRTNKVDSFRSKIRRLDLLAVDDVHFIANKKATQQEFLHSLDAIELGGAKIVLASDSHPKQIAQFSEALISRCVRGMVVQVHRPELATRAKILQALALRRRITITDQAVRMVAEQCVNSIRDIEGVLSKLHALASLAAQSNGRSADSSGGDRPGGKGVRIDRVLAESLFRGESTQKRRRPVRFESILRTVTEQFSVGRADICGRSRHRQIVLARAMVAYFARRMTSMSYPEIGAAMGRSTHSTVITAARRIEKQIREGHTFIHPVIGQQTSTAECVAQIEEAIDRAQA